ncbi:MAG: branched-chain amino acid ABC transporter permease [Sphaerochaeta sp.]|nr:branched-chain amino acid ABC transporter permease [Sphaerochaeta sp.]
MNKKSRIALLILIILLIIFNKSRINPYYSQIIQMIAINAILALGLNLVFGHTGQISIGQAGFYALGAYTSAILEIKLNVSFLIAWPSAVILTCLVAYAIGKPILKLHGHYLAMATIAFGMIVESLATNWLPVTSGHDGIYIPTREVLGPLVAQNLFEIVVISTGFLYVVCENIEYSRIGRAIRSVRENEIGASAIGIEHSKYKVMMFVLGGGFSAIAGIFYAHLNTVITPEVFNMHTSIQILMIVVLGGIGSNIGVVMAATIVTILPELLYGFAGYNILVYGVLVCIVLVFAPKGLFGLIEYPKRLKNKLFVKEGGNGIT